MRIEIESNTLILATEDKIYIIDERDNSLMISSEKGIKILEKSPMKKWIKIS